MPKRKSETPISVLARDLDPRNWGLHVRALLLAARRVGSVVWSFRSIGMRDVMAAVLHCAILYAQSCAFATALFGESGLFEFIQLGVECHLMAIMLAQLVTVFFSETSLSIAGPDPLTTILTSEVVLAVRDSMVQKAVDLYQLQMQQNSTGGGGGLFATKSPTSNTARGHLPDFAGVNRQALLATALAAIAMATTVFGTFVYFLGRLKLSRAVQLVPGAVISGFLASIGTMILLKSIKASMPTEVYFAGPWASPQFWAFYLPALPVGVGMFLQRRRKWPALVLPLVLLAPLALFYVVLFSTQSTFPQARSQGWLAPAFEDEFFYTTYQRSYGAHQLVDWDAIRDSVPSMLLLCFIGTLDCLSKLAGIRRMLSAHELDMDHELSLIGKFNVVDGFAIGVPALILPKHVAISFVMKLNSRVAGMLLPIGMAAIFFAGFPIVNYLPRFWLAGNLVFSALPFLVEHLWDGRLKFSRKEFGVVWVIVIVNFLFGLAWAILMGIVLSAIIFAIAYSKAGAVKSVESCAQLRSSVLRSEVDEERLRWHGAKAAVFRLHRYLFFGSAAFVSEVVQGLVNEQKSLPEESKVVYFCFDWTSVEDLDVTAVDVVRELVAKLLWRGGGEPQQQQQTSSGDRIVLFTGLGARLQKRLGEEGILSMLFREEKWKKKTALLVSTSSSASLGTNRKTTSNKNIRSSATTPQVEDEEAEGMQVATSKSNEGTNSAQETPPILEQRCFDSLDAGLEWIEERLLQRRMELRALWTQTYPALSRFHARARLVHLDARLESVFTPLGKATWMNHVRVLALEPGQTLVPANAECPFLYVVFAGTLSMRSERVPGLALQRLRAGALIHTDALYLDNPPARYLVVADSACVLWAVSCQDLTELDASHPSVGLALRRRALKHAARSAHKFVQMRDMDLALDVTLGGGDEKSETDELLRGAQHEEEAGPGGLSTFVSKLIPSTVAEATTKTASTISELSQKSLAGVQTGIGNSLHKVSELTAQSSHAGKVVVENTELVLGSALRTTRMVMSTTFEAAKGVQILTGLREEDNEDEALTSNAYDTSALHAGAGEESGRLLARNLNQTWRRRRSGSVSSDHDDASHATMAPYREWFHPWSTCVGRDVSTIARALLQFPFEPPARRPGEEGKHHRAFDMVRLNASLQMHATMMFVGTGCVGYLGGGAPVTVSALLESHSARVVPLGKVREALVPLGLIWDREGKTSEGNDEQEEVMNLAEFLALVRRLLFWNACEQLPESISPKCDAIVHQFASATRPPQYLTAPDLVRFVQDTCGGTLGNAQAVVESHGPLDAAGLVSLLALFTSMCEMDADVEWLWREWTAATSPPPTMNGYEAVQRALGCPESVAKEFAWLVSGGATNPITFSEFVQEFANEG